MAKFQFVKPTEEHLVYLAANMRRADIAEIKASHGHSPLTALQRGLRRSTLTAVGVEQDGTPVIIFGLNKRVAVSGVGIPWLLGTDRVRHHAREFLEVGRQCMEEMLDETPYLVNYVHDKNRLSVRWLRKLGFTLDPAQPAGLNGELFHRFHKERTNV